jgi:PrtD family type I secretion system ABC transporter
MEIAPSVAGRAWLAPLFEQVKPQLKEAAAVSFFVNLLGLAAPVFVLQVYDRVVFHAGLATLAGLAIGMVFACTFDFLLRQARARMMQKVALAIDVKVGRSLFDKIMALPLRTLEAQPGPYWQVVFRDVDVVRNTLSGATALLAVDLPFTVLFIALIFVIAWPVGWVLMIVLAAFLALAWRSGGVIGSAADKEKSLGQARDTFLGEIVAGRVAIKALGLAARVGEGWERRQYDAIVQSMRRGRDADTFVNFGQLLTVTGTVAMTTVGALAILNHTMTIGSLIAANMLAGRLFSPMNQLVGAWRSYAGFRQSAGRLGDLFLQAEDLRESGVKMPRPEGRFALRGVRFGYGGKGPPAIAGITLDLPARGITAVMGLNGSGKTTLVKLLLGLYQPQEGRVLLDDADIAQFARTDLAEWIGYAPQDALLLNGTIRENIAHGRAAVDDAGVLRAAALAQAHKLIIDLPQGYATLVGEGGSRLSGGMRQRISIARALAGDPAIVVLDEPTASLDRQAEEDLARALARLAEDHAVLVVTHSPVLLNLCSHIVVLDRGRVAAEGPPRQVMAELARKRPETPAVVSVAGA